MIKKFLAISSATYIVSLILLLIVANIVSAEILIDPVWDIVGKTFLTINFCAGTFVALLLLLAGGLFEDEEEGPL